MYDVLKNNGFVKELPENNWVKKNWTVRILDGEVEAFNNPLYNLLGKYHKCACTEENLKNIIDDINAYIEKGI